MVVIGAAALAGVAWVMRRRAEAREQAAASQAYAPNAYGVPPAGNAWGREQPPAYPGYGAQPGYPPPGYGPQPAQPGMGGRVMGGLATGLAVGAGALAAQEIGRRMMGEHGQQGMSSPSGGASAADSSLARDAGLGSIGTPGAAPALPEDFGIQDTASWDSSGSFDVGGGGDGGWDS